MNFTKSIGYARVTEKDQWRTPDEARNFTLALNEEQIKMLAYYSNEYNGKKSVLVFVNTKGKFPKVSIITNKEVKPEHQQEESKKESEQYAAQQQPAEKGASEQTVDPDLLPF